jgi:hypothetical protein
MHTAATIIVCLGATLTAAFLLAGYIALLSPDQDDLLRFKQEMDAAKQKGAWEQYRMMRRGTLRIPQIVSHWRSRPSVRRSILIGLASGIITFIAAQFI